MNSTKNPDQPSRAAGAGEQEVLQTPDYNAPPSEGAIKSTGAAADADAGVGGALGQPPAAARKPADTAGTDDGGDAELGENQGGGDDIADEMKPRH